MIEVKNHLLINSSGNNGPSGMSGQTGSHGGYGGGSGSRGYDGQPGLPGQHSQNITVTLTANEGDQKVLFHGEQQASDKYVNLGNPNFELELQSIGGNGGHGGRGGNGGRGGHGYDGRDATRYSSGTNGGPGGRGGDGGNGGMGGQGGDGGIINVITSDYDADLLMYVNKYNYKPGTGGYGGGCGHGGSGGSGGRGGFSYSWSETVTNNDGTTSTRHHSNPGGFSGPSGPSGHNGMPGVNGIDGTIGSFNIQVSDTGFQYPTRYNLSVSHADRVISDDGIIEPGEQLNIPIILFKNEGAMPTPKYQDIEYSLQNNKWIYFNNTQDTIIMKEQLHKLQEYTIERPMQFRINQLSEPALNNTFKDTAVVDYRATVQRVNKQFNTVTGQTDKYQIRYPVEISHIIMAKSITFNEEAPFAIGLKNISQQDIGINSLFKSRLLRLYLKHNSGTDQIKFIPKTDVYNVFEDNLQKLDFDKFVERDRPIEILRPSDIFMFSGTLKFSNPDLPSYSKSEVKIELDLGHIDKMNTEYQTIQIRTSDVQLSESYEHRPNSQFLLIVNSEIDKQLVDKWKQFANYMGTSTDVWNLSNYGGFLFSHKCDKYDTFFYNLLKDKIVIFFNNDFNDNKNQKQNAINYIGEQEIYKAAHFYGIASYVIRFNQNDGFKFANHIQPYSNYFDQVNCTSQEDAIIQQKKQSAILQQKRDIFITQQFEAVRRPSFAPPNPMTNSQSNNQLPYSQQQTNVPTQDFNAPPQNFNALPPQDFNAPPQDFNAPPQDFNAPPQDFNAPPQDFNAPPQDFNAPPQDFNQQSNSQEQKEHVKEINVTVQNMVQVNGGLQTGIQQPQSQEEQKGLLTGNSMDEKESLTQEVDPETLKRTRAKFADTYQANPEEIQLQADETQQYYQINDIEKSFYCCSKPSQKKMDYIANNLHKNLEKNIPNKNFLVVYDYKPKMLEEGCMKKHYNLGNLQIREGLPKNRSYIASTMKSQQEFNDINDREKYTVIKLMRFQTKLKYLKNVINNQSIRNLYFKAIIADLVEEIVGFSTSDAKITILSKKLINWNTFKEYNFDDCQNEREFTDYISDFGKFLMNLRVLLNKNMSFCCCQNALSDVSKYADHVLSHKLKDQFQLSNTQQQEDLKTLLEKFKPIKKQKLAIDLQYPYNAILFNNINPFELKTVQEKSFLPYLNPSKKTIQEGQYKFLNTFTGEINQEYRLQKIGEFESQIYFDD